MSGRYPAWHSIPGPPDFSCRQPIKPLGDVMLWARTMRAAAVLGNASPAARASASRRVGAGAVRWASTPPIVPEHRDDREGTRPPASPAGEPRPVPPRPPALSVLPRTSTRSSRHGFDAAASVSALRGAVARLLLPRL